MEITHIHHHLSTEQMAHVKKLTSHLAEIGHLHYFCYGHYSAKSDHCLLLANTDSLLKVWAKRRYPLLGFTLPSGWHLWETHLPKDRIEACHQANIGKGIYFVQRHQDFIDVFSFGTKPDNKKAYEFYLNNQNLLQRFAHFFKKETHEIMTHFKDLNQSDALNYGVITEKTEHISLHDSVKKHFLKRISAPFDTLSAKEAPCYKLFLQGHTNCEISKMLGISPSTVDSYFSRIKKKLTCSNRIELFQKAIDAGLVDYYLEIL